MFGEVGAGVGRVKESRAAIGYLWVIRIFSIYYIDI